MKRLLILLAGCFLLANSARALEYSSAQIGAVPVTVVEVELGRDALQLFLADEQARPYKRFAVLAADLKRRSLGLVFAMNAGMYHADFSPVGLFVVDGRVLSPLNVEEGEGNFFLKPNGVFAITVSGAAVIETSAYPKLASTVKQATQSGPLLLRGGQINAAFKPGSVSRLRRNGVCARSPDKVAFVITDGPVNLYEFAAFFRDHLACQDALYLDGAVSALHAPALGRSDARVDLGPIIGVTQALQ